MNGAWRTIQLREALTPVARPVELRGGQLYQTLGVRWYGNGAFAKPLLGAKIAARTLNQVRAGDIVYSKLFAWKGSFGVIPDELDGAVASSEFPTYRVDADVLLPDFFELWSSRPELWDEAADLSTGTTANSRNRLASDQFQDLEVEAPPVDEQRRIVAAARRVTRAERAHQRQSDAAFAALRAYREELLVTEDAWDEAPDGWSLLELAQIADIRSGVTKGRKTKDTLRETPFIRAANVQDGFLDLREIKTLPVSDGERERFALRPGDVLMTEGGNAEHVGRGWLWEGQLEAAVGQNHVFRVRPDADRVHSRFLAYAIGASPARAYCLESSKKTTNLASINKTQVSALVLPIPPLAVQIDIVGRLDRLRAVGVHEMEVASRLRAVASALIDDMLTGAQPAPATPPTGSGEK